MFPSANNMSGPVWMNAPGPFPGYGFPFPPPPSGAGEKLYNKKRLLKFLGWTVALLIACHFTKSAIFPILIPLMFMAMGRSRNEPLFGIILVSILSLDINGYFMPKTVVLVASQKVMMMIAATALAVKIFGRRQSGAITPVLWLVPYLLFMSVSSQLGWCPIISNMKMLLFVMVMLALYGCAITVMQSRSDGRMLREMMLAVACIAIFGSLLVRPFSGICMMGGEEVLKNPDLKSLFKGMAVHSQTLGPWIAMFSTFIFADLVFTLQRKDKLYYALLLCCPVIVYMTASRTAMGSYLAGMMFVAYLAINSRMVSRGWRSKIMTGMVLLTIFGGAVTMTVPQFRAKVMSFVVKYDSNGRDKSALDMDTILSSRRHKLDQALFNWRRSPTIGNGFQVSEEMQNFQYRNIASILSAPIEKSTWIYAVLEEGGIVGMILFCMFAVMSVGMMIARKVYIGASLLFTFLVVNLGEFAFFAMSATGGLFWCLVFVGITLDYKRLQTLGLQV